MLHILCDMSHVPCHMSLTRSPNLPPIKSYAEGQTLMQKNTKKHTNKHFNLYPNSPPKNMAYVCYHSLTP